MSTAPGGTAQPGRQHGGDPLHPVPRRDAPRRRARVCPSLPRSGWCQPSPRSSWCQRLPLSDTVSAPRPALRSYEKPGTPVVREELDTWFMAKNAQAPPLPPPSPVHGRANRAGCTTVKTGTKTSFRFRIRNLATNSLVFVPGLAGLFLENSEIPTWAVSSPMKC